MLLLGRTDTQASTVASYTSCLHNLTVLAGYCEALQTEMQRAQAFAAEEALRATVEVY